MTEAEPKVKIEKIKALLEQLESEIISCRAILRGEKA
jgi:hypothetical protein